VDPLPADVVPEVDDERGRIGSCRAPPADGADIEASALVERAWRIRPEPENEPVRRPVRSERDVGRAGDRAERGRHANGERVARPVRRGRRERRRLGTLHEHRAHRA
jgi:hypothetical protein